jgi:hypothetical protein
MVAIRGWISVGAYVTNDFARSTPPKEPTFVRIDDQMAEWMEDTTGEQPDMILVLPVMCALARSSCSR